MKGSGSRRIRIRSWSGLATSRIAATTVKESWKPGLNNSLVDCSRMTNAAAQSEFSAIDCRPEAMPIRKIAVIVAARTLEGFHPVSSA